MRTGRLRNKLVLPLSLGLFASNLFTAHAENEEGIIPFLEKKYVEQQKISVPDQKKGLGENLDKESHKEIHYPGLSTLKETYLTLSLAFWKNDIKMLRRIIVPESSVDKGLEEAVSNLRKEMLGSAKKYSFDKFMEGMVFPKYSDEGRAKEIYRMLQTSESEEEISSFIEYIGNNINTGIIKEEKFTPNLAKAADVLFVKVDGVWMLDTNADSTYSKVEMANFYLDKVSEIANNFKKGFDRYPHSLDDVADITVLSGEGFNQRVRHVDDTFSKNSTGKFKYVPFNGEFVLYSVGPDEKDDTSELLPGLIKLYEKGIIDKEEFKKSLPFYNKDNGIESSGDIIRTSFD